MQQFSIRKSRWIKPTMAGFMVLFTLLLGLFASSSTLHYAVHDSSPTSHEQCVFCSLAHGQIETPSASQPTVIAPEALPSVPLLADFVAPASFDYSVALSRGPPSV